MSYLDHGKGLLQGLIHGWAIFCFVFCFILISLWLKLNVVNLRVITGQLLSLTFAIMPGVPHPLSGVRKCVR